MSRERRREQTVVGWREWVSLPDLGISAVKAKMDTGARTSSLHAFNVRAFERDGRQMVRFDVHPIQRDSKTSVRVEAELTGTRVVRSSTGHAQRRHVIETVIEICGRPVRAEVTLTRRDVMGFRMLIGRKALAGAFVVDPNHSFIGGWPEGVERPRRRKR